MKNAALACKSDIGHRHDSRGARDYVVESEKSPTRLEHQKQRQEEELLRNVCKLMLILASWNDIGEKLLMRLK